MSNLITRRFPIWALLATLVALREPTFFVDFKPAIVPLLSLVMFGMGMTLTFANFQRVLTQPKWIGLGVSLQFLLMPFFAWALAWALQLDPILAAGLILVGAAPGGTASNVICYLAKGDVALSISLTAISTLLAVVLTPMLALLYIGERVPVPALAMLWATAKIVLLPVAAGVLLNHFFGKILRPLRAAFPAISVLAIVFIIAIVVALNAGRAAELLGIVAIAVIAHNLLGLISGYSLARLFGADTQKARTLAIEVGMQNSGLAVSLAAKFFPAAAALPGADRKSVV